MRSLHPDVPRRIHEYIPDARLIYIVRHPYDRIESNWRFMIRESSVPPETDLNESIREKFFMDRLVHRCKYNWQLEAWYEYFSPEQLHVVFLEDYTNNIDGEMKRLFQFLDVDPTFKVPRDKEFQNTAKYGLQDSSIVSAMKKVPLFETVRDAVPAHWRRKIEGTLKKKVDLKPKPISQETWDFIRDEISDDVALFLRNHGKREGYWKL